MSGDSTPTAASAFFVLRGYLEARASFTEEDVARVRRAFLFRRPGRARPIDLDQEHAGSEDPAYSRDEGDDGRSDPV